MPFSHSQPLLLRALTLLGTFGLLGCTAPLTTAPLHTRLSLSGLPPLTGPQQSQALASQLFSFRIITPVEKVDLFSILQSIKPAGITLRQAALPVGQLKAVQAARQRIESSDFVNPQDANTLAFDTARLFNWDTEVARQVLVEIVKIYTTHRDREIKQWRQSTESLSQQVIARAKAKQDEIARQDQALYQRIYQLTPAVTDRDRQNKGVKTYISDRLDRLKKNQAAQAEHAKQAKAAQEKYLAALKIKMEQDRAKSQREGQLRATTADGLLKTQSLKADQPFYLHTLHNGDFILEASAQHALPALIQLRIAGFEHPIAVPILPQTLQGRLLISIDSDEAGFPVVRGGMDASSGGQFDLNEAVFTLRHLDATHRQLEFLYPDGRVESLPVEELAQLERWDQQPQLLPATHQQLSATQTSEKQAAFAQIQYAFLPLISQMPPEQALDILQTLQEPL
jgi:hypothetical protein